MKTFISSGFWLGIATLFFSIPGYGQISVTLRPGQAAALSSSTRPAVGIPTSRTAPSRTVLLPTCASLPKGPDEIRAREGIRCQSSTGRIFTKVYMGWDGDSWRDETTGLTWSMIQANATYAEATEFCNGQLYDPFSGFYANAFTERDPFDRVDSDPSTLPAAIQGLSPSMPTFSELSQAYRNGLFEAMYVRFRSSIWTKSRALEVDPEFRVPTDWRALFSLREGTLSAQAPVDWAESEYVCVGRRAGI